MLAAEHYSLENAAVQKMLGIRERELDYIDTRMTAMGTQVKDMCTSSVLLVAFNSQIIRTETRCIKFIYPLHDVIHVSRHR